MTHVHEEMSSTLSRRGSYGRWSIPLAWGGVVGVVVFNLGWLAATALQAGGYSSSRDDVSDLGALTADSAWVMLTAQLVAGWLTVLFALCALRPALALEGRGTAVGAWLLAGSLMGLDNLSDTFFRLDCRAADPGCTSAASAGSWHGVVHYAVGGSTAVLTVAAVFALAHRMRRVPGWQNLATPAVVFGVVFLVFLVAYAALERKTGGGLLQRGSIALLSVGIVTLAARVLSLARTRSSN